MEKDNVIWTPDETESKKLYESFLIEFPLERLKNLTIEEYTNLNKSDSFCYWVETKLRKLGSIQGATSYKFGIYEFNKEPRECSGYSHDEKYAWLSKYGSDSKSAYETILSNLVKVAECARLGDFDSIDNIDMSNMFKWKIAFLYSDYKLLNVFSEDGIRYLSKKFGMENTEKATFSQMYKYLLEQKGDEEGILEYSAKIWNEWLEYTKMVESNKKWYPDESVYNPNITKEQWKELILDKDVFSENALITFACISKTSKPTCADMANEFGRSVGFYNTNVFNTGRKICKKMNCPLDTRENGDVRYWSVCCKGRDLSNGRFEYKIRPELEEAFEETGVLEDLEVYEKDSKNNMKYDKEPSGLVSKFTTLLKSTRNLILTGAPGTGKTYLAKEIAAAMGCTENEIGFVQFHPSYDYTDFVEGLRPVSKDNCDNVGFERKDGVFKEFCKRALDIKPQNKKQLPLTSANGISFNDVYDSLLNDVKRGVITTYDRKSKPGKLSYDGSRIRYENDKTESEDNMKLMYDYYIENQIWDLSGFEKEDFWNLISQLTNGKTNTLDYVEYGWTLQQLLNRAKEFLNKGNKEIVVDDPIASDEVEINEETKPFVFIIDEINRGEISKIFGELFFSIDPGYRGEKGRVKTQYQNLVEEGDMFSDGFFVPENVYIIGTMNDIDRSVESMDFAFRRRFAFAEVKAEDNVKMLDELEVLDLKDDAINRMNRLNSAISKIEGLSSAYHIGASYFLKLKEYGDDCWEALWNYHLEGLLREYLRGMPNADEEMRKLENAYWGNESDSDN